MISAQSTTVRSPSRATRVRQALTRREWSVVSGMSLFILLLHVIGWGALIAIIAPKHYQAGPGQVFGVGLGVTAYTLGMRHAFDADHIAAIDNTTRKLMAERKRPLTVGFWFSLGHSTVVFVLCALLAFGVRSLAGQVEDNSSTLQTTTGLIGTLVSGLFLCFLGIINLVVLLGIVRIFREMRRGEWDEGALEAQLARRGFMNRLLGKVANRVTKSWHIYPIGVLFGLGFDTATEISLLVVAGGAAAFALPWYAIMVLPVLFAAGMSLFDAADGCFMNFAYGWALSKPVRKVYFNITITGLSVAVALIIGMIELVSIVTEKAGIDSGPLAAIGSLNLNYVGYAIVGLFVVTWAVALAVWRWGRIEEKWSTTSVSSSSEARGGR